MGSRWLFENKAASAGSDEGPLTRGWPLSWSVKGVGWAEVCARGARDSGLDNRAWHWRGSELRGGERGLRGVRSTGCGAGGAVWGSDPMLVAPYWQAHTSPLARVRTFS